MNKKLFRIKKLNNKGFTLVECIVAVALFAIIGTLAFSMFNNSARYMNKAKKEEEKQSIAMEMSQAEKFTYTYNENVYPIIYSAEKLKIEYTVLDADKKVTIPNYNIEMTYATGYGDVTLLIAIKLAPTKNNKQPGLDKARKYQRYLVLSDVGSIRYLFIYTEYTYDMTDDQQIRDNLMQDVDYD